MLAEGREMMARASSEADNYSKIAWSTLSTRFNRSSSNDLKLVRIIIPIKHKWQTVSYDISSYDLEETVLEAVKDV